MEKSKHLILLNRSFWPDIEATGQFLTELCEELLKEYQITVIAGRSYYIRDEGTFKPFALYRKEQYRGMQVIRLRHTKFWKGNLFGRMTNWMTFTILAFFALLFVRRGLMIICTDPPFSGFVAVIVCFLRRLRFIFNCRDLYPDVALGLGEMHKGFLSDSFDWLNRAVFRRAARIVVIGESMKARVEKKGIASLSLSVIPDWADCALIRFIAKKDNPLIAQFTVQDKFVVMYSGNLGLSQGFDCILDAALKVQDESRIVFLFVGNGSAKDILLRESKRRGLKNCLFFPYQPLDTLSFSLNVGDLHLVPLKKGVAGAIVPSKLYGIMAAGRPYLALTDELSEPALLARQCGCGIFVQDLSAQKISQALRWALEHPVELAAMGEKGRQVALKRFDKKIVIDEWRRLIPEVYR